MSSNNPLQKKDDTELTKKRTLSLLRMVILLANTCLLLVLLLAFRVPQMILKAVRANEEKARIAAAVPPSEAELGFWIAPEVGENNNSLVKYGKELIAHTAAYLGPKGTVMQITNGMNCQNCHLQAGTKVFGNNYGAVLSTYPKFRPRSGSFETIPKRVNDCFERSLNGKALDTLGREMKAIVAYITWLGKDVPEDETPKGAGLLELPFLDRAADPSKGKIVYEQMCSSCHQPKGEGKFDADGIQYLYPPLWGKNSYNSGAGLFRLSRFAGYAKGNMPLGVSHLNTLLTDEQAWDVAAFVNSQPRPSKDLSKDWPDISKKPIDHPFGPFADGFSETQHKFGPFKPIKEKRELMQAQAMK
jgi:thiosulfate dehydrogenase